jgi:signal transduction histidine kinase
MAPLVRTLLTVLLFGAAFCVVQRLTFTLRFPPFNRTTIWTPGALFFTALLLVPPRRWWVMVAGLCLGVFTGYYEDETVPVATAMLSIPSFCVAVGLGAWGVRRFGSSPLFGNLNSLTVFVLIALLVTPVLTQAPEDIIRYLAGADDVWPVSLVSMLCMALGTLIATPALTLTLANGRAWLARNSWKQSIEMAALGAGLLAVGHLSFGRPLIDEAIPALLYAPLPLLLWAAVRFELAGVSWALLVLAFQSTWGAVHGHGPFASQSPAQNVLQIQFFLLAVSLPLMFLATAIQERRRAFSALSSTEHAAAEARQELAHASRLALVGEIAASIAHEINQPLGAILSNVDALEMLLDSTPSALDEVRQIVADIRKDDLRAVEVIRRLRRLLSKREIEIQPIDVNEATAEVVLLVRAESRRRGVAIETDLAADLPLVQGNKVHLQQVLLNLFLNGMEAMADAPGTRRLTVHTALNASGCAEISVSDNGSGIPSDRIGRLFEPFFSTKKEGMGLGLSIARSLVEAQGGRIWAENNPSAGATFRIALPASKEQQGREAPRPVEALVETRS